MKRVTIYDVAKEAKVSLATVSRVMNGSDVVKQATKEKVENAIAKLGYKPNAIAQGLALQRTTTIGLIFPESGFGYTGQLINGLCDVAKIYNYSINLHTITEGITNIEEVIDEVIKSRVDGVVIYSDKSLDESTKLLDKYSIPMVVIGNRITSDTVCCVYVDYQKAVYDLTNEYIAKGRTDVAILEDRRNSNMTKEMIAGAKMAYENNGLEFDKFIQFSNDVRSTYKLLRNYFKDHKHDLMIVNRDSQALAVINAARENNIRIPEEMELVCLNDTKYNSMVRPEVSAFVVPTYDLGAVAMRLMTKMLITEEVEDKEKTLEYLFRERDTTRQ